MKRTETFQFNVQQRVGKDYPARYELVPVRVDVEVDFEAIAYALAKKALSNRKGVSKLAVGVTVKAVRR
jgi:hypothetical protein